jgi:hypothetical protein
MSYTILYPRRNGTGDAVLGKKVPDYLVPLYKKNGFSETPDLTNTKAAEYFVEKKLNEAKSEIQTDLEKLKREREEFEAMKAVFLSGRTELVEQKEEETQEKVRKPRTTKEV